MTKKFSSILTGSLLTAVLLTTVACLKDDDPKTDPNSFSEIEISVSQIPDLGLDYSYHAWLQSGSNLVEIGELNTSGGSFSGTFVVGEANASGSPLFFLTVESFDDQDPGPSDWRVLEVTFDGANGIINNAPFTKTGSADLASGSYILATPTTVSSGDEFSGIWWVDAPGAPQKGLELPELKDGWTYEGWVDLGGLTLSTGTFSDPGGSDDRSVYSSAERPPFPFPGEDFVRALPGGMTAPDLRGQGCFVTIEPVDGVAAPFFLKILEDDIAPDALARTAQPLIAPGSQKWLLATAKRK